MPFGTAQNRLRQDLFWMLLVETGRTKCCICNEEMSRDTFSIEHKVAWQDSDEPQELFFDLNNIDFAHRSCNCRNAKRWVASCGSIAKYNKGCRCEKCVETYREYRRNYYCPDRRRRSYLRTGK